MTNFTNVSMTRNTVKKYADLQAHVDSLTNDLRICKGNGSAMFNELLKANNGDLAAAKEAGEHAAEYTALKAERDTIQQALNEKRAAFAKFIARYAKAPKLGAEYQRSYKMSLSYPRDGIGRLKLNSSNLHTTQVVSGCGYDKQGAVLGKWISETFDDVLQSLNDVQVNSHYGLNRSHATGKVTIDGACGFGCMVDILNWLGYTVHTVNNYGSSSCELIGLVVVWA